MRKKLVWAVLLCLVLAAVMPMTALAAGEEIHVSNVEELVAAIADQEDGDTIILDAGTYDVADRCTTIEANINGVASGFVLPIFADNVTLRAAEGAAVTLTSSFDPNTGNWNQQNFITISGSGVTLENLTLQGNPNGFYDGTCNKIIELIDGAKNVTLKNLDVEPLTDSEGKEFTGSIYVNVADAGNTLIEDVTLGAWINARAVTSGTVTAKDVTIDFVNNSYSGAAGFNPAITYNTPGCVSVSGLTVEVDENINLTEQVLTDFLPDGTTIRLNGNVALDKTATIKRNAITLDLNGNTISASDSFQKDENNNNNHLVDIVADGITVKNGTLVAGANNNHTLNVWNADSVVLEGLTLNNAATYGGAPLIVGASNVTVQGALKTITGAKSWYAVNVDSRVVGGTDTPATLTIADGAQVAFEGVSPLGIVLEHTAGTADVIVNIAKTAAFTAPEGVENFVAVAPHEDVAADDKGVVIATNSNPALTQDENGNYIIAAPAAPEDKPAEKIPETGDSMVGIAIAAAGALLGAACIFLFSRRRSSSC